MKGTLEKLRRMLTGKKATHRDRDEVTVSQFARSTSFKRASMRRSQRRPARKKVVVTNRGIYYVDEDEDDQPAAETLGSRSDHSQGTISYTDWIQISDDETLDRPAGDRKSTSRNFSLEGKSVPFDSPLPSGGGGGGVGAPSPTEPRSSDKRPPVDEPPVVSTFGSSCTSGVYSMEKPADGGRAAGRRRPPTVVATRDQLRRSLRRVSGRKAKKARRQADADQPAAASLDDEFYRRLARLPLVLAREEASSAADAPVAARIPFAFSRQNPITRWLDESEKLRRRAGPADTERLLWSELVSPPAKSDQRAAKRVGKAAGRAARARTPSRKSLSRKPKTARSAADAATTAEGAECLAPASDR